MLGLGFKVLLVGLWCYGGIGVMLLFVGLGFMLLLVGLGFVVLFVMGEIMGLSIEEYGWN